MKDHSRSDMQVRLTNCFPLFYSFTFFCIVAQSRSHDTNHKLSDNHNGASNHLSAGHVKYSLFGVSYFPPVHTCNEM